jgi:hypothetical protein
LNVVNVTILSGACCNPSLAVLDEKVQNRINEVAGRNQLQVNISMVPISTAAFAGTGVSKEVGQSIRALINDKGMSVLPTVIFNGSIAFYGGLASAAFIQEKLLEVDND